MGGLGYGRLQTDSGAYHGLWPPPAGYAPATVNSMLAAVNTLFRFQGWEECRVKFLKIQKRLFREPCRKRFLFLRTSRKSQLPCRRIEI